MAKYDIDWPNSRNVQLLFVINNFVVLFLSIILCTYAFNQLRNTKSITPFNKTQKRILFFLFLFSLLNGISFSVWALVVYKRVNLQCHTAILSFAGWMALERCVNYIYYLSRLKRTFKGTVFEMSHFRHKFYQITLGITSVLAPAFFVTVRTVGNCTQKSFAIGSIMPVLYDFIWSCITFYEFNSRLRKVVSLQLASKSDARLEELAAKLTNLFLISTISHVTVVINGLTYPLTSLVNFKTSVFDGFIVLLSLKQNQKLYYKLCTKCHKLFGKADQVVLRGLSVMSSTRSLELDEKKQEQKDETPTVEELR